MRQKSNSTSVTSENLSDEAFMKTTCFPCHNQVKARHLVFTRYAQ
jgi:hypothetical protein